MVRLSKYALYIAVAMLLLSVAFIVVSSKGCAHVKRVGPALSTLGGCALHTTLGCVTQAAANCATPAWGWGETDWDGYGVCLSDTSSTCSLTGLAGCVYRALVRLTSPALATKPKYGDDVRNQIRRCVMEKDMDSEEECIEAVACCQRDICIGEDV